MQSDDIQYYRARARHARRMAEAARDPGIKAIHNRMAIEYEALAEPRPLRILRIVA